MELVIMQMAASPLVLTTTHTISHYGKRHFGDLSDIWTDSNDSEIYERKVIKLIDAESIIGRMVCG